MAEKLTYFISDLHLGARYIADPKAHERKLCDWLRSIAPTACRIYLVGDIIDYWYEYRNVAPQGYVRFLGTLADLADSGIEITWLIGNHDIWMFGYLQRELGIRVVDGVLEEVIDGKHFVITHGDGIGKLPFAERFMRAVFRNKILQTLFAAVHPRWTVGLAYSWSSSNRKRGAARNVYSHEPAIDWVKNRNSALPENQRPDFYIFGHYHNAFSDRVEGSQVTILADCITSVNYAVFDGNVLSSHSL